MQQEVNNPSNGFLRKTNYISLYGTYILITNFDALIIIYS